MNCKWLRRIARPIGLALVFIGLMALTPAPAHAYLDPVSGSIILQVLAAGALAAMLGVKRFWSSLKSLGRSLLGRRDEP